MRVARGDFEVTLEPRALDGAAEEEDFGRLTLDKTFSGDLAGRSHGQMLSAGRPAEGEASYVALERFRGTLHGREGSFVLLHRGTMHAGQQELRIEVAAGSGTEELEGLTGTMALRIEDGRHEYELSYELP